MFGSPGSIASPVVSHWANELIIFKCISHKAAEKTGEKLWPFFIHTEPMECRVALSNTLQLTPPFVYTGIIEREADTIFQIKLCNCYNIKCMSYLLWFQIRSSIVELSISTGICVVSTLN